MLIEYLLDTNICIHYFKGQFGLKERIEKIGFENFAISEITLAELIYGAEKSQQTEKNMKVVENFAENIEILPILGSLKIYGKEKARLKSIGKIIGDLDLFIGSTAIVNDMIMVTRNIREFERINGISIENWIDE
ncbi:MAG: type II toxin-antitoxin system VapC family toxin [Bacteroidota bacterium]|nr:type II toxin-antitoxin system VapC family toxin [Bacteroidota bacterium]